tara:strand:- start:3099 stop:3332 length:234 start_codon:yes stop_codon:yes gene_type:complete
MTAVWLLIIFSIVMFSLCVLLSVCAYRISSQRKTLSIVFVSLAGLAFLLSALSFGEALMRVDAIENNTPPVEIKPPF